MIDKENTEHRFPLKVAMPAHVKAMCDKSSSGKLGRMISTTYCEIGQLAIEIRPCPYQLGGTDIFVTNKHRCLMQFVCSDPIDKNKGIAHIVDLIIDERYVTSDIIKIVLYKLLYRDIAIEHRFASEDLDGAIQKAWEAMSSELKTKTEFGYTAVPAGLEDNI